LRIRIYWQALEHILSMEAKLFSEEINYFEEALGAAKQR